MECTYCGREMRRRVGSFGAYLECPDQACCSRIGIHRDGRVKGTPARYLLRQWRKAAHAVFDMLWRRDDGRPPAMNRREAYAWLRSETGISHIGESSIEECLKILAACAGRDDMDDSL